ncbi:hypothetical protein ITJ43_06460 [Microbacterium sp. VKM Ac-2870]|uniref:hypothetical protein n=1 Tax=Microbacterium sp. VKM Ac-2870 TaxID=2783825 RepID=UPI00188D8B0C|nr:hypothetical protein [Microbacterium sp. VKM Ac-2870]MBF4561779.1 hypothetical protein [Microbacterium sp. VKM Ac-2870]
MSTRGNTSAAGAVVAVAVLQLVVLGISTAVWITSTMFAGNACDPNCDWSGADRAGILYFVVCVAMSLCTAAAVMHALRTGRDAGWVPLAGSAGIVVGLLVSLAFFHEAMS